VRIPVAESATRYTAVAIVLHWAIATAIIANLALGWWMHRAFEVEATQAPAIAAFQLHKSLGLTVLALSLLRLAWRLLHRPPPLPAAMRDWEKLAAKVTHGGFYALMVALPLSGWLYVSTQWRETAPLNVPTLWFGLFEVPHLCGLNETAPAERQALAAATFRAHLWLAWSMAALLALHVGAALKHRFVNRDTVLANMLPATTSARIAGAAAILAAIAGLVFAVVKTPGAADAGAAAIGDLPGATWSVGADSAIGFSGTHAGTPFTGRFTHWRAGIRFDAGDLAGSSVTALVETASARDGDALHEETLPQAEWFDVAKYPTAEFRSTAITPRGDGRFDLHGTLTIKDRPLALAPLMLTVTDAQLLIDGRLTISRRDANLGMESDPNGDYVSPEIAVDVRVSAARKPGG